ncbi:MAG: DivIVA domain-containing protein [Clostridia bacterium]|nr:DivIVA domain-containing protein [Clostridia bacterium]
MMLTPVEIEARSFSKSLRGYNAEEVDSFLSKVSKEYEKLYRMNQEYLENIGKLERELEKYSQLEKTLNETLVLAKKTAEDTKQNALKEAELIIEEARKEAQRMISQAEEEVKKQKELLEEIKKDQQTFAAEFRTLLRTYLELLDKKLKDEPGDEERVEGEEEEDKESKFEVEEV